MSSRFAVLCLAVFVAACSGAASLTTTTPDGGFGGPDASTTLPPPDGGNDGGPGDAGPGDAGPGDAGPGDGGPGDGGVPDGGPPPDTKFFRLRPSPIAAENRRSGQRGWQCRNFNPDLAGYSDRTSYLPGDQVSIHAAFAPRPTTASWQLWRMGYYGGALGRLVASGGQIPVPAQTPTVVDGATGAVSAPWPIALSFAIPTDAVTGIYLVKLTAPEGESLIPLIVREATPSAAILYSVSTNTYQAYNAWGGTSLYVNQIGWMPPGATSAPFHAFAVSFDRPYLNSLGTGEFLSKDRDFVTFVEGQGYDVAYVTDTDLDGDPQLLDRRRMLVVQGHSEYWTRPMRNVAETAIAADTNAAFFAANDAYWQVRFSDDTRRLLLGYKEYCSADPMRSTDPSRATCLWRDATVGKPENAMSGSMYGSWIWGAAPLHVADPSAWIWAGTGVTDLTTVAGLYQNESDHRFDNGAEPRGVETVANGFVQSYFGGFDQAETTLYTAPSGASVFNAGSIGFSRTLAGAGLWDPVMQQLVANLFSKFGGDGTLPADVKSLNLPAGAPMPVYRSGVRVSTVTTALTEPSAVVAAPDGTAVVVDGNRIVQVDLTGQITLVAGAAISGNRDGPGATARFNAPRGVAVAPDGTIYVSDTNNNRIRLIRNGTVCPLAGSLSGPDGQGFADGQGSAAMFAQPMGIAVESNGNLLVADPWNLRIREVTPDGLVTTWLGSGAPGLRNAAGTLAALEYPMAIAVGPNDDAFFIEPETGWLRKVTGTLPHTTSQLAGQLFVEGWQDGPVSSATTYHTVAIAVRPSDGQILLADGATARIRALRDGVIDTLAGGLGGGTVDGRGDQSAFSSPRGIAIAPDGSAFVVDTKEHALRRITGF